MLNTFPTLLSFAILVPFVFRICVAYFLIEIAVGLKNKGMLSGYYREYGYPLAHLVPWKFQIFAAGSAFFLAIGLFTQISALVAFFTILAIGHANREIKTFKHSESAFAFAALICFSLLFLGAGAFAFDIPL